LPPLRRSRRDRRCGQGREPPREPSEENAQARRLHPPPLPPLRPMTIAEQLPLAFEIRCASFCPCLLAPLRANIDRFQAEARAALDGMDEDCKGTMAWDSCGEAIDHLDLDWLL